MNNKIESILIRLTEATGDQVPRLWGEAVRYVWWSALTTTVLSLTVQMAFAGLLLYWWRRRDQLITILNNEPVLLPILIFFGMIPLALAGLALSNLMEAVSQLASPEGWLVTNLLP